MYLLYAPPEKFQKLPPKAPLISDEVLFTHNVAYCPKYYWYKIHILKGCRDVSPGWMKRLRPKRILRNVLIFATGGLGDSMWSMPFARAVREKYPTARIIIIADRKASPVWQGVPFASGIVEDKFWNVQSLVRNADEIWDFGGIATILKKEMKMDPVEAIFYDAKWPLPKDKSKCKPAPIVQLEEGQRAQAELGRRGVNIKEDTIISISLESSTPNRNWPFEYVKELTKELIADGKKVLWLGESVQWADRVLDEETKQIGAVNFISDTSVRQVMALIAISDLFIGPNSGLMVIATALGIPTIGLFGAFNPMLRAKYYTKFVPIWGRSECAPCNEHWTECPKGNIAPCMKLITSDLVYNASIRLLKECPRSKLGRLPIE